MKKEALRYRLAQAGQGLYHRPMIEPASYRFPVFRLSMTMLCLYVATLGLSSCAETETTGADSISALAPDDGFVALMAMARICTASMSDAELVGQVMMTGVHGTSTLDAASHTILNALKPGAIILFGYNITTEPRLLATLTSSIRSAASVHTFSKTIPPFVAIDHEGGPVYRFKAGLTRLPSAQAMGIAGDGAAMAAGHASGFELRALGITMNMAPVVEASNAANRTFLYERAWSSDPESAGRLSAAFISASQANGLAAVAKHYPGNVATDPHVALPVLEASMLELDEQYEVPFRWAIEAGVSTVMLSHVLVPELDPLLPVSVSFEAIDRLKARLGFKGIVLSDDINMAALSGLGEAGYKALSALMAGADMLMLTDEGEALRLHSFLVEALSDGRLDRSRLEDAVTRILMQKLRFGLDIETDEQRAIMLDALEASVTENRAALLKAMSREPLKVNN